MSDIKRFGQPISFWNGRTLRIFGLALILLAAVRWGWGAHFHSKVQAQWDQARQRGEPTAITQIKLADVTDANNAWTYQLKASNAIVANVESPRSSNLEYKTTYPPYGPKWMQLAEGSEAMHGQVFALARQARAHPLARWHDALNPDPMKMWLPGLNEARNLANIVTDGAQLMELRGQHVEAVARLRDVLHIARSVRQDPFVVGQLVAFGIDALACNGAQIIAPGLGLQANDPDGARTRVAVKELIADLLDDTDRLKMFRDSFYLDRLMSAYMISAEGNKRSVIRPLADRGLAYTNQIFEIAIEASNAPDASAARAIMARTPLDWSSASSASNIFWGATRNTDLPRYSRWFNWAAASFHKCIEVYFRNIAERRLTAIILASQLFKADRNRWPEKLDELVPAYLPAVPRDPFRTGTPPMGYVILRKALPDLGDRPLVYFEPSDLNDKDYATWRSPIYDWIPRPHVRQYRDLARFRFPEVKIQEGGDVYKLPTGGYSTSVYPPPSQEGIQDDPAKPDAPGQDSQK